MKWILLIGAMGWYVTSMQHLNDRALSQAQRLQQSYSQIIDHPEAFLSRY